tara:strand:- start:21 stop:194 length:174 start_codon:yes stop_codon:yes gene_type:complete
MTFVARGITDNSSIMDLEAVAREVRTRADEGKNLEHLADLERYIDIIISQQKLDVKA